MNSVVLWDFDGTLAHRPGLWTSAIIEALDDLVPAHNVGEEDVRPLIMQGFPWHQPHVPHPHLSTSEAWWAHVGDLSIRTMQRLGFDSGTSAKLAEDTRRRYIEPLSFRVFEDTRPALEMLANKGWRNIILSNHVPELASIVNGVGLGDLIETVITSALTGYEKPHPTAFSIARSEAGNPTRIWMVGDNPDADVLGAEAAGIPAILVRREDSRVTRQAADLFSAIKLIGEPAAANDSA